MFRFAVIFGIMAAMTMLPSPPAKADYTAAHGIVYRATAPSGKAYIGQTTLTLAKRIKLHSYGKYRFARAVRKYGEAIEWQVVAGTQGEIERGANRQKIQRRIARENVGVGKTPWGAQAATKNRNADIISVMDSIEILFWSLGALAAAVVGAVVWLNARSEGGRENLGKRIGAVDDRVGAIATEAAVLKADRDRANARLELLETAAKNFVCKQDLAAMEERLNKRIDKLEALIQARK